MECNIEEIGRQILESSNGKIVIRAPLKYKKEWQDWLQGFQLKSNSSWIVSNMFPSCSRATFRKDYVCQHSDFNKAVHGSKLSKNTVCKAITANTRAKDKYVKACMINTYFPWLRALNIRLTETISARYQSVLIYCCIFKQNKFRCETILFYLVIYFPPPLCYPSHMQF